MINTENFRKIPKIPGKFIKNTKKFATELPTGVEGVMLRRTGAFPNFLITGGLAEPSLAMHT